MDNVFLDWMNATFGATVTTIVGVLIFVIPITIGVTAFITNKLSTFKNCIKEEALEEKENDDFKKDIKDLISTVNELKDNMEDMDTNQRKHNEVIDTKINNIQETITENEETSRHGDEVLKQQMEIYEKKTDLLNKKIDGTTENINLLIESDKESIKSYITTEYYACREKKYIELYILQTLENRYNKYLQENGNTFVAGLMDEMRKLPHEPYHGDIVLQQKKSIMPKLQTNFLEDEE